MKKLVLILLTFSVNLQASSTLFSMNLHCTIDHWKFRVNKILDRIAEVNPQVISFQEVCVDKKDNMITYIENGLKSRGIKIRTTLKIFTHIAWDKYDEYMLLFSTKESQEYLAGPLPKSPLRRAYIATKVDNIWFINIHLEHRQDYAPYREKQIQFLTDKFKNKKHIIMGDFNSSPDYTEQTQLQDLDYTNFFPGFTHPLPKPVRAIDGFWVSPGIDSRNFQVEKLLEKPINNIYLSDHSGVLLKTNL